MNASTIYINLSSVSSNAETTATKHTWWRRSFHTPSCRKTYYQKGSKSVTTAKTGSLSMLTNVQSSRESCPQVRNNPRLHSINTRAFKKPVIKYYAIKAPAVQKENSWNHVLGFPGFTSPVKAAHIVPKGLSAEKIAHIFGQQDEVITDPRNGKSILITGLNFQLIRCLFTTSAGCWDQYALVYTEFFFEMVEKILASSQRNLDLQI